MLLLQATLCLGIGVYAWTVRRQVIVWPLLLLLSGAFANVVDRFINRAVTDYIDFFLGIYHWPAFNLADVWITFGVIGVIAVEFVLKQRDTKHLEMEG